MRCIVTILALVWIAGCSGRDQVPKQLPQSEQNPVRAWSTQQLADLRETARRAPSHGLRLESDVLEQIDQLDPLSLQNAEMALGLDGTADALFERLALSFAVGGVDPVQADPEWRIARPSPPDVVALRRAVAEGADVSDTLYALLPGEPEYAALVAELDRVQTEADGVVDANGLSKETRVGLLRASLERWRWLPRQMPTRRLEVLVPFFELNLHDGEVRMRRNVIVGAPPTPTPTFIAAIEAVTLNPTWTPPTSILQRELLPRFRLDPSAVATENFDVIDSAGRAVDPANVDWRAWPFPYTLRQRAGPSNALGSLRFDLPNPHRIFLHDTPSRGFFARADRALSHGCIRVDEAVQLAAEVLADPNWDLTALTTAIDTGVTQVVALAAPLPVYVLYMTAWPDQNGTVRYADDVYARDAGLLRSLDHEPSVSIATDPASQSACTE